MAKLRRNYVSSTGKSAVLVRVAIFAAILVALANAIPTFFDKRQAGVASEEVLTPFDISEELADLGAGTIAGTRQYSWFALAYSPNRNMPVRATYLLTRQGVNQSVSRGGDSFSLQRTLKWTSKEHQIRMVPVIPTAGIRFRWDGYMESQRMVNSWPQAEGFYQCYWLPLEWAERKWALAYKKVYIESGPIWYKEPTRGGGRIPDAYYKAVLDLSEPGWKSIGFIIPHQQRGASLLSFACSVDSLESMLGVNLFKGLMSPPLESELESTMDIGAWAID